jgi:RHS repeat-associated protein
MTPTAILITGAGRTIGWTAFNKVASMTQGTTNLSWEYGPERQRIKQVSTAGDTYYYSDAASGASFEKLVGATVTQWNHYLFAGGNMVGVHFTRSDATKMTRWFVKDHLGSVAVLTDETGAVAERLSYDAWGKRRYPTGADDPTGSITASTTRGFTGHEMIDDVDLVNMNGRVYDPNIGRFMSADPFIHEVTNSQDLNRYSYVHNNPLSYTDQDGYGFFKKLGKFFKKIWRPLLAIVAAFALQFYALPALAGAGPVGVGGFGAFAATQPLTAAVISGVSAGVSNVILTGKPKSFLSGFGQGVATFGVGSAFSGATGASGALSKTVAHGVVGGAFSEVRGGSFKSGFLAAGFSSAAGNLDFGSVPANVVRSAVFGGAGSVLGGGKFADGAVTGAFTYVLNDLGHRQSLKYIGGKLNEFRDQLEFLDLTAENLYKAADAANLPNWMRTVFAGIEGTVALVGGYTGSLGIYVDRATGDYGNFITGGLVAGGGASGGLFVGFIPGSADDFCCWFGVVEGAVGVAGPAGVGVSRIEGIDNDGYLTGMVGYTLGAGVGTPLHGAGGYTYTHTFWKRRLNIPQ